MCLIRTIAVKQGTCSARTYV